MSKLPSQSIPLSVRIDQVFYLEMKIDQAGAQCRELEKQQQQLTVEHQRLQNCRQKYVIKQRQQVFDLMNAMSHRRFCKLMGIKP